MRQPSKYYELMQTIGPMTTEEMSRITGTQVRCVAGMISRLRKRKVNQDVRVVGWERYRRGHGREDWRAIYGISDKPDVKRPRALTDSERSKRLRARRAAMVVAPASVFHLAQGG